MGDSVKQIHREWLDYYGEKRELTYKITKEDALNSNKFKESLKYPDENTSIYDFYGYLYLRLQLHDDEGLNNLVERIRQMQVQYDLGRNELANAVTSMVQNMEYFLILDHQKCKDFEWCNDCWVCHPYDLLL